MIGELSLALTVEERRAAALARVKAHDIVTSAELALVLRLPRSTFDRHLAAGAFEKFRLLPQITRRPMFAGELVERYLAGDPRYVPATFGAKRGAR